VFRAYGENVGLRHVLKVRLPCSPQEEFDEAVKTNIEDFDMEVIMLLLLACGHAPSYQRAFMAGSTLKRFSLFFSG
jgi:hypothetical protein